MVNASSGQILYVSIQYRIGVLGFLAGSEIAQEGVQNAGLLDQRVALEWIQRHISQFGGDPTKVTVSARLPRPRRIGFDVLRLAMGRFRRRWLYHHADDG